MRNISIYLHLITIASGLYNIMYLICPEKKNLVSFGNIRRAMCHDTEHFNEIHVHGLIYVLGGRIDLALPNRPVVI